MASAERTRQKENKHHYEAAQENSHHPRGPVLDFHTTGSTPPCHISPKIRDHDSGSTHTTSDARLEAFPIFSDSNQTYHHPAFLSATSPADLRSEPTPQNTTNPQSHMQTDPPADQQQGRDAACTTTPTPHTMDEVPHPAQHDELPRQMPEMARSDSSSASSVGDGSTPQIVAPVPVRPRLPSRKSSGTIIVPRDSVDAIEPAETRLDPGDVRAMSPRRTSEDLENLGREARDELRR